MAICRYMKKTNEDYRRELYINALIAYIRADNSTNTANMEKWADAALKAYDENFKPDVY